MEENVALDSSKQQQFVKSIKGLKKLIKKNNAGPKSDNLVSLKGKDTTRAKKRKERGLVYLSHIPHGFYEHEMTQYFKQFGVVSNARVIRSKRTGRSKGFAFVEFKNPTVAQIVAETMNNYLMGKRLIKAVYIPPEKQRRNALRKNWNSINNPGFNLKKKLKKAYNENKDVAGELKRAGKLLSNLGRTKKKLNALGINYDFFMPVDIPDALINKVKIKQENVENEVVENKDNEKLKKKRKADKEFVKEAKGKEENQGVKKEKGKKAKNSKIQLNTETVKRENDVDKKLKLKKAGGVSPPESFIKIAQDSADEDESDSPLEFDSDEYEKMLQNESDDDTDESQDEDEGSDNDDDDENNTDSDNTLSDAETPVKKNKKKFLPLAPQEKAKKKTSQEAAKFSQVKRKAAHKPAVATKKTKFEKQEKQSNKQFKKKK